MKTIKKVAAMVFKDNCFLMVRKTGKDIWTSLGGRIEKGETEEEALHREIMEEVGCEAKIINKLGDFSGKAIFDDAMLNLAVYHVELIGNPRVTDSEIDEFRYVCEEYEKSGIKLTETIINGVIPFCKKEKLLDWS